jgi:hypothetical protein
MSVNHLSADRQRFIHELMESFSVRFVSCHGNVFMSDFPGTSCLIIAAIFLVKEIWRYSSVEGITPLPTLSTK